ncbi:MAG: pyridine nucleotide-disulfide oxidoreductase, partial [Smithellaceae bacterium]|nr:pyridine nucleotide-disulfide oxidoreductase [Smithellaceae bacterium]
MSKKATILIPGMEKGQRVDSRVLEERIQRAVCDGFREIEIVGHGQHGMGGRLWQAGDEEVRIRVLGISGQRLGAMGFPNTLIDAVGPASDDVGWLNSGARIVVRGNAGNGAGNAMAQGKIYIAGNIGARGMTMTKQNPRFAPPELWVLGSTGDSFAEFMAGGIAVICGHGTTGNDNVLGWRPCVGMVGGKIYFRGKQESYSANDALLSHPGEEDWQWLVSHMKEYLGAIARPELMSELIANRDQWQIFSSRKSRTKTAETIKKLPRYYREVWNKELGPGGIIGDLTSMDRSLIPVIAKGELRRFEPLWENHQWAPPCQANCPSGIPVQQRWELIRQNKLEEAVDLALSYTPFPASVCGHLCPNLCMQNCTRQVSQLPPIDISLLGRA